MKFAIILGTRPEIIKLYSLIKFCDENKEDYILIHTNQHYSENMDKIFFDRLELPKPHCNLGIGSDTHGKQTGAMLEKIEEVLIKEKPTHVFVQGDTNTVLAGALAASKLDIKVCHVEAGLRSYDRQMPEEINRVVADHVSDYLFCPTEKQKEILLSEGIEEEKIAVTGNTIVDAVYEMKDRLDNEVLDKNNLKPKEYVLLTMHRPSNVDEKEVLAKQLKNISNAAKQHDLKIVFPAHPRTKNNIEKFKIEIPSNIVIVDPVDFKDLLTLELNAKIVLTDSGGIQEEACILGVPCLVLRENTERPECVEVGAAKIVGSDFEKLKEGFNWSKQVKCNWKNPFGDGRAYKKILDFILSS